jgi:hypothetical protein
MELSDKPVIATPNIGNEPINNIFTLLLAFIYKG